MIMKLKDDGISVFLCSHLLEQVQEVCDEVGIIFKGRMRREGPLDDLISIDNQTSLVLENASPALIKQLIEMIEKEGGDTRLVEHGKPRTTLERLFIQIATASKEEDSQG